MDDGVSPLTVQQANRLFVQEARRLVEAWIAQRMSKPAAQLLMQDAWDHIASRVVAEERADFRKPTIMQRLSEAGEDG